MIGNPPYDVLEKERGGASWPHALLAEYLAYRQDYDPAEGGKLNLYRIFLVQAIGLTRPSGMFGMIVPMSLLGDISTAATRKFVFTRITRPVLPTASLKKITLIGGVFKRAKLSTVVAVGAKNAKLLDGQILSRLTSFRATT